MEGLVEIVTAKELYNRSEVGLYELQTFMFRDKTIMRFSDLRSAIKFGSYFVHKFLIPKYGIEEAKKFPMAKSGPFRDDAFEESLGLKKPDLNQETWLVIPKDRYSEVQEYIDSLKE
ncbi:hypothetical protein KAT80_03865 [Candidatus Pacearchaeota archaeon]|nr:hypothetical protein [Candidatus Pacearchaeota archaeon]